jgi:hypothetical protein
VVADGRGGGEVVLGLPLGDGGEEGGGGCHSYRVREADDRGRGNRHLSSRTCACERGRDGPKLNVRTIKST